MSHRIRIHLRNIFCRHIRNDDMWQVKTCSISWDILPTFTLQLFVLEWPELRLILFLLILRFASSSGFARLVSRVPLSLLIFLVCRTRLFPPFRLFLSYAFFLPLTFLFCSFFVDTNTYFFSIVFLFYHSFLAKRFTFYSSMVLVSSLR